MKILVAIMITMLLFGCTSYNTPEGRLLDEVYSAHLKDLCKKHQFNVNMTGAGGNGKKINSIDLGLSIKKNLTIDSARRLLLPSIQDLMNKVNAFEELHPYLVEVPFGYDKYKYWIDSVDKNGIIELPLDHLGSNQISYVVLSRGELCYNVFVKETEKIVEVLCESYEEALKIVENEKKEGLEPVDD